MRKILWRIRLLISAVFLFGQITSVFSSCSDVILRAHLLLQPEGKKLILSPLAGVFARDEIKSYVNLVTKFKNKYKAVLDGTKAEGRIEKESKRLVLKLMESECRKRIVEFVNDFLKFSNHLFHCVPEAGLFKPTTSSSSAASMLP